jgi:hypothetical protein
MLLRVDSGVSVFAAVSFSQCKHAQNVLPWRHGECCARSWDELQIVGEVSALVLRRGGAVALYTQIRTALA